MTKEITKAYIIQQMTDKFRLREMNPEIFSLSEQVIPVYNIEQHLQKWAHAFTEVLITTTGSVLFFTVPETERWYLSGYDIVFMGAGGYTVSGVFCKRHATPNLFHYWDLTTGQSASYSRTLSKLAVLESGDDIKVNIDGYTSDMNLRLYIDYMVEEIR